MGQVFFDALARAQRELTLQENVARLEAGADLAGLAFYSVDFTRGVMYIDDRLREILGVPPDREQGHEVLAYWMERLHPEDRTLVLELRDRMHRGKIGRFSHEYRFLHPVHGLKWIDHLAGAARFGEDGHATLTYGVLRDITTRRQAEEALRDSYAEIERLKDRLQAETDYLRAEIGETHAKGEVIGESAVIRRVLRQAEQVAPTDSTVLVLGETGTGKELIAQAIHRASSRKDKVMVKVNCAALPSGLIESELFGRERGAFTGALTRQVGRFEIADGSTLFLDEVGELSHESQAKLLRVLEAGEFERLGGPRTIKVDVRVIAATNRDLTKEMLKGRFREDLYYRLSIFPILVPPLRERVEDIPLLVWTFLGECCSRMGKRITQVPRSTMDALCRRQWPGNIRELRNVIEQAAILTSGDTLRVPSVIDAAPGHEPQTLDDVERAHILQTLERTGGHIKGPTGAASVLGIQPSTLYSRMKRLGVPTRG
jgi:transcriptional regulator with GAF, ATPase, and Fis domain